MKSLFRLGVFLFLCSLAIQSSYVACELDDMRWDSDRKHGDELQIVLPFLPENPVILEAGAHYGEDTVILSNLWKNGFIYAFEPCWSSFLILQEKTKDLSNVKIFSVALFSESGFFPFNVNLASDGSSSLLDDNHMPEVTHYQDSPTMVYCINLDEWAEIHGVNCIDYMWLDMEGVEWHVLSEAPKILQTVKAISTEINFREFRTGMSMFSDLRQLLENSGFTLYKTWGTPNWQGTAVFIRSELLDEQ